MFKKLPLDAFSLLLLFTVLLASIFPIAGQAAHTFDQLTTMAIAGLFFLHGAKLSRDAILQGLGHWRLHLLTLALTFALFPLLGFLARPVLLPLLGPTLYNGFLYLCFLPSTVQSSIAFTSVARGNVAAAVCSASFSNIIGMAITPFLVAFFILHGTHQQFDALPAIIKIVGLLLVPFILGQFSRRWVFPVMQRHPKAIKVFDQGSILMVVYGAFSAAVLGGLWHQVSGMTLLQLVAASCGLLAVAMLLAWHIPCWLGFNRADQKTIFFCGSKKTLASGIPMAQILFMGQPIGLIVLPIMLFHQIQLMVCGILAARWSHDPELDLEADRTA